MRPVRLTLRHIGPYDNAEWDVPTGLTAIVGQNADSDGVSSNGAGKTKLLEAIPLALFGPKMSWSDVRSIDAPDDEPSEVVLEFESSGQLYRIRRTFTPKGRGKTTCDFEIFSDDTGYAAIGHSTQADTSDALANVIGCGEDIFDHAVFARQSAQHFADPDLSPRERKRLLYEALGLDQWEQLRALAHGDVRALEAQAGIHRARMADLADGARNEAEEKETLKRLKSEAKSAEALVSYARIQWENAVAEEHVRERMVMARRHLQHLVDRRDEAEQAARDLAGVEREIARLTPIADAADADLEEANRLTLMQRDGFAAAAELEKIDAQIAGLEAAMTDLSVCDRCQRPLAGESFDEAFRSMRDDHTKLVAAQMDYMLLISRTSLVTNEVVSEARARAVNSRTAVSQIAAYTEQAGHLRAALVGPTPEEIEDARADVGSDEPLVGLTAPAAKAKVAEADAACSRAIAALSRQQSVIDRMREDAKTLRRELASLEAVESELSYRRLLARGYGADGIPALILADEAIPHIEADAQRILDALGVPFRIELITQRETKTTGAIKDTLEVMVIEPRGARPYKTYSGGERTRIEVALRIALARMIAKRFGRTLDMLALDEVAYLDASGMERLASVLRDITAEFSCIMVISHDDRLVDSFDNTAIVHRSGGRSTIVV